MKTEGIILAVNLKQFEEVREIYPNIQFVDIETLDAVSYFNMSDIIAVIFDIDNYKGLSVDDLESFKKQYRTELIITSNSYKSLTMFEGYGITVFKNISLIGEQILHVYGQRVKRNESEYIFNYVTRTVIYADKVYKLRNTPFLILCYLVKNKNRTCSREELIKAVGGTPKLADSRTIDVHINYIRRKLGDKRIKTVVNEGYVFEDKK